MGGVEGVPVRDALAHPRVDLAGVLDRGLVGVDQDVDRGQVAHGRFSSAARRRYSSGSAKTVFQSSFMLTTVQPRSAASAMAFSASSVYANSRSPSSWLTRRLNRATSSIA